MLYKGKLSPNVIPGDLYKRKSALGMELSGRDQNGRRVVGIVPSEALGTTVVVNDRDLLWTIPEEWSMRDAVTILVAYCTAYYALVIRGRMKAGQTVLIHCGSGAVGEAAIRLALNAGLTVFTTVSSYEKRRKLM